MKSEYDAIVVGAGHSGLVAAFYLARAGNKVLVVERRELVGGTCVTEEVFPGFFCSSVANSSHSVDPRIIGDMELQRFGLRYTVPELGSLTLFNDGEAFVPWPDQQKRKEQIERFAAAPGDIEGFGGVLNFFQRVATTMDISFYEDAPSLSEVAARFATPGEQQALNSILFGSVADILDRYLESWHLKAFFAATAVATNMIGPKTPGSAYLLLQRPLWERSMASVGTMDRNDLMMKNSAPLGGIGAVVEAMAASCRAIGVDVELGTGVQRITTRGSTVTGVVLDDGREVRARRVISNADPKLTFTQLVDQAAIPEEFQLLVQEKQVAGSSAKVHLRLSGTPRFASATDEAENELFLKTNFRVASSIDTLQEAYNECVLGRWHEQVTVTGIIDSAIDPTMAPEGQHVMSLSVRGVPYHLAEGNWDDRKSELGRDVVATLGQYIPNLENITEEVSVYSPLDLERDFGLLEGNGAHGDITPGNIFNSRPFPGYGNNRTPIDGLYLCGTGVWPGNFMSGVTGYNAAQRVAQDEATNKKGISA